MIVVEKTFQRFGTVQVLNNLEFVAPQNQVVGFLECEWCWENNDDADFINRSPTEFWNSDDRWA